MYGCLIPMTDFFKYCQTAAFDKGFLWIVCLLSREADSQSLYENLKKQWNSLNDITGSRFVFMFAGHQDENCDSTLVLNKITYREISSISNPFMHIFNIPHLRPNMPPEEQRKYLAARSKYYDKLPENQTKEISELRDYFQISEKEIPCLIFISLTSNKRIIVPVEGDDLYSYFKKMIINIEDKLKQLNPILSDVVSYREYKRTKLYHQYQKHIQLRAELKEAARNLANIEQKRLIECINQQEYGSFPKDIRRKLDQYVDLGKLLQREGAYHKFEEMISNENQKKEIIDKIAKEIEAQIEENKMSIEGSDKGKSPSAMISGSYQQINIFYDKAVNKAKQNINVYSPEIQALIEKVRENIPMGLSPSEARIVNDKLDTINSELAKSKPKKRLVNNAVNVLLKIKNTAEFGAAVATLVQFIQTMI